MSEEEYLEISTWQYYRTYIELVTEIAVQIQDKFKLVIQGALREGKITFFSRLIELSKV